MNRILRDKITADRTITQDEITITLPGRGIVAGIEITTPDQRAVTVHGGRATVYVASTSRDASHVVKFERGKVRSCTCEYHNHRRPQWIQAPCVHVRCADAALSARSGQAVARGAQLAGLLKSCGWSAAKFRYEVRKRRVICGGDLYAAVAMLESQTLGDLGYERAA